MALVLHRLKGKGLYLFDEPESALSPTRQMGLMAAMHALVGKGSQFIVATHSPILLGYPGATIYLLTEKAITRIPYTETEHYVVTRSFLNNPDGMLRELLTDPAEPEPEGGDAPPGPWNDSPSS
jgi:predicted ATPase